MSVLRLCTHSMAASLMRVAHMIWPTHQSIWRDAACAEFATLTRPSTALSWALGCCRVALVQSVWTGAVLEHRVVRWSLAAFMLGLAHEHWFAGRLMRALSAEPAWALQFLSTAQLAVVTRLPAALNMLLVATALCYAMAAYQLLRQGRRVAAWYGAASLGNLIGLVLYTVSAADAGVLRIEQQLSAYAHWLLAAALSLLLWRHARSRQFEQPLANTPGDDRSCG